MNIKTRILLSMAILSLTACDDWKPPKCTEQQLEQRKEVFYSCLDKAQKQPHATNYNDTSEVVEECRQSVYVLVKQCNT